MLSNSTFQCGYKSGDCGCGERTFNLSQMQTFFPCTISRPQIANVVMGGPMRDEELDLLHNAELKEAFDEFDKVKMVFLLCYCMIYTNLQIHEEHTHLHTHGAQCGAQGGFR